MMAYNRPPQNDAFFQGGRYSDVSQQQQGMRQPSGLPSALPLHQAPTAPPPSLHQPTGMNAASLAAAAAAAASPGSLESRMMMRRLMIQRAAQEAQNMQSLHNALMAEANVKSLQQQLQQQQQQQQLQQHHNTLLQQRQNAAMMNPYGYQQSPIPGLDLLRSVSLAQQQQQINQHQRAQLGLPSIGQLDQLSFLSPSPNQPPARLASGDFSMLPRAPFSHDPTVSVHNDALLSPSNNSIYSPSPASTGPRNTVKLFIDEIREWDVLCGRGGRSNRKFRVATSMIPC
jgi:hypothetical protein